MKKLILHIILLVLAFAFLVNASAQDEDIIISDNTVWEAGAYTYNNVHITAGATLTLNGAVTIHAQNLTIDSNSSISADNKGYPDGSLSPKFSFGKEGEGLGEFKTPISLAIKNNLIYVADSGNSRIQVLEIKY